MNQNLEAVASIDIHASWLPSEVTGGGFYYTDLSARSIIRVECGKIKIYI